MTAIGRAPLDVVVKLTPRPSRVPIAGSSGLQRSGNGGDFSPPYEACATVPAEGEYVVDEATIRGWLTGDRACNAFSTCRTRSEGKKACIVFTLQGHNDCQRMFSSCDAVRESEGHVEAVARLRPSAPHLTAD